MVKHVFGVLQQQLLLLLTSCLVIILAEVTKVELALIIMGVKAGLRFKVLRLGHGCLFNFLLETRLALLVFVLQVFLEVFLVLL